MTAFLKWLESLKVFWRKKKGGREWGSSPKLVLYLGGLESLRIAYLPKGGSGCGELANWQILVDLHSCYRECILLRKLRCREKNSA